MTDPQTAVPAGEDARVRPAPPEGRRYAPGQSGNPKGGPKRPTKRAAEVEWLFRQEFTVEIDGERQRLPLARALLLAQAHRALKGDAKAASDLLGLMRETEKTREAQAEAKSNKAAEKKAQALSRQLFADWRWAEARSTERAPDDPWDNNHADVIEALRVMDAVHDGEDGALLIKPWVLYAAQEEDPSLGPDLVDEAETELIQSTVDWSLEEADLDPPAGPQQPAEHQPGGHGAGELGGDEGGNGRGGDAGEAVAAGARDGDRRVGEGGRGGEPVGGGDVEADDDRRGLGTEAQRPQDRPDQAEGGDELGEGLAGPAAQPGGNLPDGLVEHGVGGEHAEHRADHLDRQVGAGRSPADFAAQGEDQGHGGVEMAPGDGPEDGDQHHQPGPGGQGVGDQGDGVVPARQPFGHDP